MKPLPEELSDEILDEAEARHGLPHAQNARYFEERARALPAGAPGRAAWLTEAGEAWELAEDLDNARRCYEDAVADGGGVYLDPRAELLGVLLDLGETTGAEKLLTELRAAVLDGDAGRFVHESVGEALELHGRLAEALQWFSDGLAVSAAESSSDPDIGCLNGRYRVRRALGMPHDGHDRLAEERREEYLEELDDLAEEQRLLHVPGGDDGAPLTVTYWPPAELESLLGRWPSLAEDYGGDAGEHRSRVEQRLRHLAQTHAQTDTRTDAHARLAVGHGTVQGLLDLAAARGEEPDQHLPRALYAGHLARTGRTTSWPPPAAGACWCGSGVEYQKCCGTDSPSALP